MAAVHFNQHAFVAALHGEVNLFCQTIINGYDLNHFAVHILRMWRGKIYPEFLSGIFSVFTNLPKQFSKIDFSPPFYLALIAFTIYQALPPNGEPTPGAHRVDRH